MFRPCRTTQKNRDASIPLLSEDDLNSSKLQAVLQPDLVDKSGARDDLVSSQLLIATDVFVFQNNKSESCPSY